VIDPHSLEEMASYTGATSLKNVMDSIAEAKKTLEQAHGQSLTRSTLARFEKEADVVRATLEKSGAAKAMTKLRKLEKFAAKLARRLGPRAEAVRTEVLAAASKELDGAAEKIDSGDLKGAKKILTPLRSALKGTDLEARVADLIEKSKTA
jgi:hypothetical protein